MKVSGGNEVKEVFLLCGPGLQRVICVELRVKKAALVVLFSRLMDLVSLY